MGRRTAAVVAGLLVLALAACGDDGGGGDEDAFCDALESLSDQVADGDLASEDGLEDATDTANELLEAASADQEDAVTAVGESLAEADPDDAADTAETVDDELGDLAEDCDIDDFAEAPEETTTTAPEETTTTGGDETTTTGGGGGDDELNIVVARVDPATAGVEPGFETPIDECFRGLMASCDDLFFGENGQAAAPDGSAARGFAATCGGRIPTFANDTVRCVENLGAASEFDLAAFDDASFETLATTCQDGDMAACDTLFSQTGVGSEEELYGRTCGFRLGVVADRDPSVTACVDIFGATAEFG
jgi:hypothetical protein